MVLSANVIYNFNLGSATLVLLIYGYGLSVLHLGDSSMGSPFLLEILLILGLSTFAPCMLEKIKGLVFLLDFLFLFAQVFFETNNKRAIKLGCLKS
jgi:hypothetical protein